MTPGDHAGEGIGGWQVQAVVSSPSSTRRCVALGPQVNASSVLLRGCADSHLDQLEMRPFRRVCRCFQHGGCLLPIGCSGGAPHAAGAPRSARNSPPSHRTKCSNSLFFAPGDAGLVWGLPEAARMHERASLLLVCAQQGGTDACEALTLMLTRSTRRERCARVRSPASSSSTP